jgi:hypothetical protein
MPRKPQAGVPEASNMKMKTIFILYPGLKKVKGYNFLQYDLDRIEKKTYTVRGY